VLGLPGDDRVVQEFGKLTEKLPRPGGREEEIDAVRLQPFELPPSTGPYLPGFHLSIPGPQCRCGGWVCSPSHLNPHSLFPFFNIILLCIGRS
jgi:hypothetical protein